VKSRQTASRIFKGFSFLRIHSSFERSPHSLSNCMIGYYHIPSVEDMKNHLPKLSQTLTRLDAGSLLILFFFNFIDERYCFPVYIVDEEWINVTHETSYGEISSLIGEKYDIVKVGWIGEATLSLSFASHSSFFALIFLFVHRVYVSG
jgi:hypothetical protein